MKLQDFHEIKNLNWLNVICIRSRFRRKIYSFEVKLKKKNINESPQKPETWTHGYYNHDSNKICFSALLWLLLDRSLW